MRTWKILGHYNAETQAYSAVAGTFKAGDFSPDVSGRLVGIRLLEGQEAATSLMCSVAIRLSCSLWKPNTMELAIAGGGLKTVPVGFQQQTDYQVDQPIQAGVPVTIEGKNDVATAVTVSVIILGCIEVS